MKFDSLIACYTWMVDQSSRSFHWEHDEARLIEFDEKTILMSIGQMPSFKETGVNHGSHQTSAILTVAVLPKPLLELSNEEVVDTLLSERFQHAAVLEIYGLQDRLGAPEHSIHTMGGHWVPITHLLRSNTRWPAQAAYSPAIVPRLCEKLHELCLDLAKHPLVR